MAFMPPAVVMFRIPNKTLQLDTTTSFAAIPAIRATMICQYPSPKDYLTKAGTVIFVASVIMWALLNFGPDGYVTDISRSFGSLAVKALVPLFRPAGPLIPHAVNIWKIRIPMVCFQLFSSL